MRKPNVLIEENQIHITFSEDDGLNEDKERPQSNRQRSYDPIFFAILSSQIGPYGLSFLYLLMMIFIGGMVASLATRGAVAWIAKDFPNPAAIHESHYPVFWCIMYMNVIVYGMPGYLYAPSKLDVAFRFGLLVIGVWLIMTGTDFLTLL